MKTRAARWLTVTRIVIWTTIGTVLVLLIVKFCRPYPPHPLEEARAQVPIGTQREDAIRILSETAWYYQPCPNRTTIDDLFFYGSHRYDEAEIVIVSSEPISDTYVVYQISSFEYYAWQRAFQDCLQRDRFED